MIRARTVLVPIDFSDGSLAALQHAAGLVLPQRGTMHLLHVVDTMATGIGELEPVAGGVLGRFHNRLGRLADSLRVRGVTSEAHVTVGSASDEILAMVDPYRVDLIVMGTHGRSGWGHSWMGGTTERVVRRAQCPVLTVKERRSVRRADDVTVHVGERVTG